MKTTLSLRKVGSRWYGVVTRGESVADHSETYALSSDSRAGLLERAQHLRKRLDELEDREKRLDERVSELLKEK